jgi:ABC-2 type transport system permease protein
LLAGMVISAGLRALVPATVLLGVGFAIGVDWPGVAGLLLALVLTVAWGMIAALWGCGLALRFKSQSAAPLMQSGMFIAILFTTAYAPLDQLQGWLEKIARINPVTKVLEAARQGFVEGGISWGDTWPGVLALVGILAVMAFFALREMERTSD